MYVCERMFLSRDILTTLCARSKNSYSLLELTDEDRKIYAISVI